MAIKPDDIVSKKFSFSFRGYHPDEVDSFLDELVDEVEYLLAENEKLKSHQSMVDQQQAAIDSMESALRDTLALAQKSAGDIVQTAQDKADAILDRAQDKADRIVEDSKARMRRMLEESAERKRALTEEYNALAREIVRLRERYRNELEAQLRLMDQEGMPAIEDEAESDGGQDPPQRDELLRQSDAGEEPVDPAV